MYQILLADDDPFILAGLQQLIPWEEYGCEIIDTVSSGTAALYLFGQTPVDILITDIKMPGLSGLELIHAVKERGYHTYFIILSGYEEFSFVKAALKLGIENYLLKPVNQEELIATLTTVFTKINNHTATHFNLRQDSRVIRDNLLYRWVTGTIEPEELLERANLLGLELERRHFCVAIAKPVLTCKTTPDNAQTIVLLLRLCEETITKQGLVFYFPDTDLVILFSDQLPQPAQVKIILERYSQAIRQTASIDCFITIGNWVGHFGQVFQSYAVARKFQSYSLILPLNTILEPDTVSPPGTQVQSAQLVDSALLIRLLQQKDQFRLEEEIEVIFKRCLAHPAPTPSLVQNSAVEIIFTLVNTTKAITGCGDELFDRWECRFPEIFQMGRVQELSAWIKQTAAKAVTLVHEKQNRLNPIVKKTLELIRDNFTRGISLKTIACDLNVNPNYLGQLFKTETGEYFSDYLNKIRINEAMRLLKDGRSNTRTIAATVGFTEPNYFYRIFKKFTGLSPTEFRNLY